MVWDRVVLCMKQSASDCVGVSNERGVSLFAAAPSLTET